MGVFAPAASWPWDNTPTHEDGWRDMAGRWIPSSVLARDGGQLNVTIGSGLTVQVADGSATIRGHRARLASPATLAIAPNTGPSTRIDRVVARADLVNNRVDLVVLGPTPSGGTAAPSSTSTTLVRNGIVWDIPLASVVVPVGATTPASVVDERLLWSPDTGLQAWAWTAAELTTLLQANYPSGPPDGLTIDALSYDDEQIGVGAMATRTRLDPYTWDLNSSAAVRRYGPRWRDLTLTAANTAALAGFAPQAAITDIGVLLRGRIRLLGGYVWTPAPTLFTLPAGLRPSRELRVLCGWGAINPGQTDPDLNYDGQILAVATNGQVRHLSSASGSINAGTHPDHYRLSLDGVVIPW